MTIRRPPANPPRDRRSLPLQVRDEIRLLIESEHLAPGDQLPSETDLAQRFGVARTTAREALKLLEQDGLIDVRHGLGRFVSGLATLDRPITRLESVTEMMAARGYVITNRVVRITVGPAGDDEAEALGELIGTEVVRLERVRLHRGDPLIHSLDVFPRSVIAGELDNIDWSDSLLILLEQNGRRVVSATAQIQAARLSDEARDALGPSVSEPDGHWVLLIQRHLDEAGRPVIYSHDYYRGDRFTFNVFRRRAE
jgi:GntR family transcriptional regulator